MQSGKLRFKIEIQTRLGETTNADGTQSPNWVIFETVKADVRDVTGKELAAHQKINSRLTHNVFMRKLKGVKPEMRIKWTDCTNDDEIRYLNIAFITEDRTHNRMMILRCEEIRD